MTHICVSKLSIIGSDNGLLPDRRQAIIWTNAGILLIGPLGTNFSEISIEILTFSFKKMRLKVSSAKWSPFCLGLNVLNSILWFDASCWYLHLSIFLHWHWGNHSQTKTKQSKTICISCGMHYIIFTKRENHHNCFLFYMLPYLVNLQAYECLLTCIGIPMIMLRQSSVNSLWWKCVPLDRLYCDELQPRVLLHLPLMLTVCESCL